MERKRKQYFVRIVACILVISLLAPVGANAAAQDPVAPMASSYLASYTAYICAMGGGDLEIWFRVTGTGTWADIGVLSIRLYSSVDGANWHWVKTYLYEDYDNMLVHDTYFNMSHVDYQGTAGLYYKAYVQIWAGPEDGGDTRYIWTAVERAT